jgi:hypothetical protein
MREIRSYGSVRGVRSNPYPYRDIPTPDAEGSALLIFPRYRTVTRLRRPEPTPSPWRDRHTGSGPGGSAAHPGTQERDRHSQTARPRHNPARPEQRS